MTPPGNKAPGEVKQSKSKQSVASRPETPDHVADFFDKLDVTSPSPVKMPETGDGFSNKPEGSNNNGSTVDYAALGAEFAQKIGTPKKVRPDRSTRMMSQIYSAVGAKTDGDKQRTRAALAYIGIVHGTGPQVDYKTIELVPGGSCRSVYMAPTIVGNIVPLNEQRRFWTTNFSEEAVKLHDNSPAIRQELIERAVRNGLPITETKAVIDFLDFSSVTPHEAALRVTSKASAIRRGNDRSPDAPTRESMRAVAQSQSPHPHSRNDQRGDDLGTY